MTFNENNYNELQQYEKDLYHAKYENYFRPQDKQLMKRFAQIFYETYSKGSNIIGGCNRCAFKDIQRLANDYFKQKEEMAKNEPKTKPIDLIEPECATTTTTTTKAATKKKTTNKNKKK